MTEHIAEAYTEARALEELSKVMAAHSGEAIADSEALYSYMATKRTPEELTGLVKAAIPRQAGRYERRCGTREALSWLGQEALSHDDEETLDMTIQALRHGQGINGIVAALSLTLERRL